MCCWRVDRDCTGSVIWGRWKLRWMRDILGKDGKNV